MEKIVYRTAEDSVEIRYENLLFTSEDGIPPVDLRAMNEDVIAVYINGKEMSRSDISWEELFHDSVSKYIHSDRNITWEYVPAEIKNLRIAMLPALYDKNGNRILAGNTYTAVKNGGSIRKGDTVIVRDIMDCGRICVSPGSYALTLDEFNDTCFGEV